MLGCFVWLLGVGFAVSLATQGQWLPAIVVFIGTNFVASMLSPQSAG